MRYLLSIFLIILPLAQKIDGQSSDSSFYETVSSPDKNLKLSVLKETSEEGETNLFYEVKYKDKPVILKSALEIVLDNHISELAMGIKPDTNYHFLHDMMFLDRKDTTINNHWRNEFGERKDVIDYYNQASFLFEKNSKSGFKLQIDIRVYNSGVAFRYFFPLNPRGLYYRVMEENTEFVMPAGTLAWYQRWAQAPFERKPLEGWTDESERPLTCELPNGLYVSLGEGAMIDYVRTKFNVKEDKPGTLVTAMHESVDKITPFHTPWRVVMVSETPGELLENNDIYLNLNEPCQMKNTDWIKPGTIMREIEQSNENSKAQMDFSEENEIDYLLYDWKWYGDPFDFSSDASTVSIDLDLQKWIEYGKEKGIGVWVYVNQQALLTQMEDIFPLYKKWGIKGVKFGFVQVGSHRWTKWLHEAIQLAAENQLMVNIHDEFRTTGENRTWPNIVTVEGIRGNEEFPDADHNTVLPFTRFVGGMGDYTICYMDKRLKTTHSHQLALGVIYFSPLQTIYWYDKPEDLISIPETKYFENLPTVWDDTKVLNGEIGKYITVARRSGEEWFVGAITNNDSREIRIPFEFLNKDQKYKATVHIDDEKVKSRTNVKTYSKEVDSGDVLRFILKDSGGVAIRLIPLK